MKTSDDTKVDDLDDLTQAELAGLLTELYAELDEDGRRLVTRIVQQELRADE